MRGVNTEKIEKGKLRYVLGKCRVEVSKSADICK